MGSERNLNEGPNKEIFPRCLHSLLDSTRKKTCRDSSKTIVRDDRIGNVHVWNLQVKMETRKPSIILCILPHCSCYLEGHSVFQTYQRAGKTVQDYRSRISNITFPFFDRHHTPLKFSMVKLHGELHLPGFPDVPGMSPVSPGQALQKHSFFKDLDWSGHTWGTNFSVEESDAS